MNLKLAESVFDKASQFLLDYLVATFKEHLPEDLSIVDAALDEALGDLWATLKDVNHHLAYFLYASADHHSRQDLESDLVTDLEAIKLCLLVDVLVLLPRLLNPSRERQNLLRGALLLIA